MPAEQQRALANRLRMALGLPGAPGSHCRPFEFMLNGENFRAYVWTCTPDRSAHGRPEGEYKIQLILPGQARPTRGDFDFHSSRVALMGYSPDAGVFVVWDATKHRRFSYSKNVQVPSSLIEEAVAVGWAADMRDVDAGVEVRVAVVPWKISHLLRILSVADDSGLQGAERLGFVQSRMSVDDEPNAPQAGEDVAGDGAQARERYLAERLARDSRFATSVKRQYGHACALCGHQLGIVEAAHIVPVSESGSSDESWNGIALCPSHHRLFDRNLIVLDEDLRVDVDAERLRLLVSGGLGAGAESLAEMQDEQASRPSSWKTLSFRRDMKASLRRRRALTLGG